ncbi:MAG TPA: HNH endonuclease signature motif containing protein [Candidatus Dormibacteraeota bacterium]|nr:HNH endonuclease signature motif containing protein [Candidatus Dormibacteraeota bacterium]
MIESERVILRLLADGFFSIDEDGRIWRHRKLSRTGNQLPIFPTRRAETPRRDGYLDLKVGRRFSALAHRIVWLHLFGEIPEGIEINHENGHRADNGPLNLEPMTPRENDLHAYRVLGKRPCRGEDNGRSKLTAGQAASIRQRKGIESSRRLGAEFGVTHRVILNVWQNKSWKEYPA